MITLIVGQQHTLTAQFRDSLNQPVNVDPGLLVWTTDDETIVSLGPVIQQDHPSPAPQTTGLVAVVKAVAPGIVNVTASYSDGVQTFKNVTQFQVTPPSVATISVS
jgi:uncharacterized protein YjdB